MEPDNKNELKIAARVSNDPGAISRLLSTVAAKGSRVISCFSDHDRYGAMVQIVTENKPGLKHELEVTYFAGETHWPVMINFQEDVAPAAVA